MANSLFPIVGVGASAGGLEAFRQMLSALPVDTGLAFVLVQHLSPTHESQLSEILSRATALPVVQVHDEPLVKPDHVYVIPPDRNMIISQGKLRLLPREAARNQHRPIDFFLRSLAEDQRHRAIGVILSGSATDGTLGLEQIKAEGGITFAQDDTAEYDSMPRSAIASGCVDFVLSPQKIGAEIGRIARHPYVVAPASPAKRKKAATGKTDFEKILEILRKETGVDFNHYKTNTLSRRISRRMVLHKIEQLKDYARNLQEEPGEVEALYQDILINVTSFFRDPEMFEAIQTNILPRLFKNRSRNDPFRMWVLGCSTGEEAYSMAITISEVAEALGSQVPVQIFASDLNGTGIEKARAGLYSKNIATDVSPERLRRYFMEIDGGYRIIKSIREMCVFARHNVLSDPPFSQIDLISCRNLLIYLQPTLQEKVMPLLHLALKPSGFLVLGSSEAISSQRDLFKVEDAKHKLFAKRPGTHRAVLSHMAARHPGRVALGSGRLGQGSPPQAMDAAGVQKEADRILLAKYVPPGVLVNDELEILQFYGETWPYLTPASGKASLSLLKMAREGVLVRLRSAINRAKEEKAAVRENGLLVQSESGAREVSLEVVPVRGSGFLVLFEERVPPPSRPLPQERKGLGKAPEVAAGEDSAERQNIRLMHDLAATREYLQMEMEQHEAANEELQAANEEVQSANEELQSINEELETSKEEIQSSNEELITLNDELQSRNQELNLVNNDLVNLLSSVDLAVLILGRDLRIRRFTQVAEKTFNLSPADVGRPITEIRLNLKVNDVERLLLEVIDTVSARELEIQDGRDCWYSLRIRPYKTLDNRIDGVVVTLIDVDTLKKLQEALQQRIHDLNVADRSKNEFLALLAHELRNPLAPLRNAVELLEISDTGSATGEQARSVMSRQIQHMSRLIDDLLDASRITQGKVQLRRQRVELANLLTDAVESVLPHFEARGQELSVALLPEPVELDADPVRLEQVFGNILNNASKFSLTGGHIQITAELADHGKGRDGAPTEVVVRVRDDGIGMEPETLAHVFDLFMQADRTLDRSRGGLGIGLTMVRRLVELHGGTVEAQSAGLGQGSELVVRLPVLPPPTARADRRGGRGEGHVAAAVPSPGPSTLRRVLVVDDNMDLAESLALLLRSKGYDVEVAYDGPAALEAAVSFKPEAVLLDIGLPGLDGFQVAGELRLRPPTESALIVAVTGYGQEDDQRRSREAGFDHHLVKPVDPQVIYELLMLGRG